MSEPDEDLFRVMIESIEPERSFFQVFWSSATHIGAAIDTIVSACVRMGISNPSAREADCVAFDSLPENAVHDKRLNIWYGPGRSWDDTVANGHVALTAYGEPGQTNLTIDTHKTIKVLTKSATIQQEMASALKSLGFEELPEFHSLEYCFYHWHYRPTRSKSRAGLVAAMKKWGFSLWKDEIVEPEDR
ncbi:MAG TPA: hypothetical protein VM656_08995 [Pyrinomonadaceae bacterium]|jgi:hypothetical protein|nr:hypothetical protein [Pyrinomonadaceae bacterium]